MRRTLLLVLAGVLLAGGMLAWSVYDSWQLAALSRCVLRGRAALEVPDTVPPLPEDRAAMAEIVARCEADADAYSE